MHTPPGCLLSILGPVAGANLAGKLSLGRATVRPKRADRKIDARYMMNVDYNSQDEVLMRESKRC